MSSKGRPQFNVVDFGAVPDGATDSTDAIQEAFDRASDVGDADVVIDGRYIVDGVTVEGDDLRLIGGGMLKLKAASAADAAITINGDRNEVNGITIDGNAAGIPTGRGEGIRINGDYNALRRVLSRNTFESVAETGVTIFINAAAIGTYLDQCISKNSGSSAIQNRGDYTFIRDFQALEHKRSGYAGGGGDLEQVTIDGWYGESAVTTKTGLLFDQGVDADGVTGYMINHVFLSNVTINLGANATFGNGVKFARVRQVNIDNLNVFHTSIAGESLRIAEAVGSVRISDSHLASVMTQEDGATFVVGALTGATASDGGWARFTMAAHGLRTGDYVVATGTASYDGLHQVTAATTNTFTTDWKFTNADASGTFATTIGSVVMRDSTIGTIGQTAAISAVNQIKAQRVLFERVKFHNFYRDGILLASNANYPHVGYKSIVVEDCDFVSNSPSAIGYAIRAVGGQFTAPGVIQWRGKNTMRSVGAFGITLSQAGTLPYITRQGSRFYREISATVALTADDSGGTFVIAAPDLTVTLPSVADVTAGGGTIEYEFRMSAAGLSSGAGFALSPNAADKIMGDGFVSEDDVDILLAGDVDREGDAITIRSDGIDGWNVVAPTGLWTSANGAKRFRDPALLYASVDEAGVAGTAETDLMSFTLPNGLSSAEGARMSIVATFKALANAANKRVRFKWGGTTIYDSGAHVFSTGGRLRLEIEAIANPSGTPKAIVTAFSDSGTDPFPSGTSAPVTVSFGSATVVKATGESSDGDDDYLTQESMAITFYPPR